MEKLVGYVDHIIYRNSDNGYTVLVLMTDDGECTVVGTFRYIDEGENLELEGEYGKHSVYGEQFQVKHYEVKEPEDIVSIERYLSSGAIKGIGAAIAKRIIRKFGEDTFRIMEEEPERLTEIKGISERIAREIGVQVEEKKDLRKAMIFLQNYGISTTLAVKIYERYQNQIYEVIKENPYRMTEEIDGVGFRTADEIAERVGIHTNSDFRIRSGLLYCLLQASAEGHVYLPQDVLIQKATQLLSVPSEGILTQLSNLSMEKKIVWKQSENQAQVYASTYYYMELNCAKMLMDLNYKEATEEDWIVKKLHALEMEIGIELEEKQRDAVVQAAQCGVLVITGGPGTGKTTTINTLIHYFLKEGMDFILAAPTGRAAKRMTETTGYESRTIHRLLETNAGNADRAGASVFERDENNPLEADVIIVDEMSMVDISLFHALLKAVTVGTKLILVGDVNQLPSVGPGAVLKDIIESGKFPVVTLQKIFRQATTSDIVMNAHKINEGEHILLDNKSHDFFFLERDRADVIMESIVYLVTKKLPPYVESDPFDIQVMTPMKKGLLGVEQLNTKLQERLNPPGKGKNGREKREHTYGEHLFREGDKVMQIKNNYQLEWEICTKNGMTVDKGLGVFNGDMGVVSEINPTTESLTVLYDENKEVHYSFSGLDELELSYAITIHKSQGSEYPAVVIPILSGPAMLLNRNLLYTGVTRAKKCVTLIGSSETIQKMIDNKSEQVRYSSLAVRICEFGEAM